MIAYFTGTINGQGDRFGMPYLIDGHNLIPKIRGLSLSALDDEERLIRLLQEFCRIRRVKGLEVYFDKAAPGRAGTFRRGLVTAHFVPAGQSADEAIRLRLKALKKSARNWTVVSADRQVRSEAASAQARVISSEEFARLVEDALREGPPPGDPQEPVVSSDELEEWLRLFSQRKPGAS